MDNRIKLPDLEAKLDDLAVGETMLLPAPDYERLFGVNDAAAGRLRLFASAHNCVAINRVKGIIFVRKGTTAGQAEPG